VFCSLPSVALSSHVRHVLALSRLLRVLLISAGPQAPFFSCTVNVFLLPQRFFWQYLHCELRINSSLSELGRCISMRYSLRGHLLWELVSPHY